MFNKKFLLSLLVAFAFIFVLSACSNDEASDVEAEKEIDSSESANNSESASGADSDFFKGENLENVVPYDTGGGSDVLARYVAPFLNEHIPGNPTVQVVNIPGAGSVMGMNEYMGFRDADGYNMIWSSGSTILNYLLQTEGVDYDFKDLTPIFGIPSGGVVFISTDTGYREPKDIVNLDEKLVYSGQSATGIDIVSLLAFEVLDLDVQAILGYEGSGPARVAFEQGETNLNFQTTPAYISSVEPLVEDGVALPLFTFGHADEDGNIIRDPAFPDIPSVKEFYEEVYGEEPSGEVWEAYKAFASRAYSIQKILWTKKDAPEEAIALMQEGAEKMANDSEFIEGSGDEILGGYDPLTGDDLTSLIEATIQTDVDQEILDWVANFIDENFED